jgi:trehalose 6-phosphate phosphatase
VPLSQGHVMDASGAVDWLAASPLTTALFTDFDGTLSPIVSRPEDARSLPGVPALLKRLAAQMLVVAVASGRPAGWLLEHLALASEPGGEALTAAAGERVEAYGLHGLEHWIGSGIQVDDGARAWQPLIAEARSEAIAAGLVGVEVEDKRFSVTLHWRNAPDPIAAGALAMPLAERLGASTGLIARPGKSSVELVPPIGVDKGSVVRRRVETSGARRVVFLGDDVSDVLAFLAIDDLVAGAGGGGAPIAGLKIAVTGEDAVPELTELADLVLDGPESAVALLTELARHLEAGGSKHP